MYVTIMYSIENLSKTMPLELINIIEPFTRKLIKLDLKNDIHNYIKVLLTIKNLYQQRNLHFASEFLPEIIWIWIAKDILSFCNIRMIFPTILSKRSHDINLLDMSSRLYHRNVIVTYPSLQFIVTPKNQYAWGKRVSRLIVASLTIHEREQFINFVNKKNLNYRRYHPDSI